MGRATAQKNGPGPWCPAEGSNIIKFQQQRQLTFHSVARVMPQGRDLGVLVVKNLNVGICNGDISTARSTCSYFTIVSCFFFLFT